MDIEKTHENYLLFPMRDISTERSTQSHGKLCIISWCPEERGNFTSNDERYKIKTFDIITKITKCMCL